MWVTRARPTIDRIGCPWLMAESKTPLTVGAPASPPPAVDLDTAKLDQIIGVKGQVNGGVYQFNVKRRDPITQEGMLFDPPSAPWRCDRHQFPAHGRLKDAITGDFVLTGDEVTGHFGAAP